MTESGYPEVGFDPDVWMGVLAPTGTPAAIVDKLNREINATLKSDEMAPALKRFGLNQSVLHLPEGKVVPQMLPPALAETLPNLPSVKKGHTVAVICSGFACKPPISEPAELEKALAPASS